ncbi:hypothetical protein WA158_000200 [Blastocystis sp. Blastoise]
MFRNVRTFELNFHVRAQLKKGQTLGVIGNLRALGSDSKSNPFYLYTTPDRYPLWYNLQPIYVPFEYKLEFRFAVFENKKFVVYKYIVKCNMDISATFGQSDMRVLPRYTSEEQLKLFHSDDDTLPPPAITFVAQWLPIHLDYISPGHWTATYDDIHPFMGIPWQSVCNGGKSQLKFIGCINYPHEIPATEMPYVEALLNEMNCFPVIIPKEEFDSYYYGFCKKILWPLLHDVVDLYCENETPLWDTNSLNQLYTSYTYANQQFAKKICQVGGDIIWIHGYHLMLVPSCISLGFRANTRLAMFFHTPFPSSDIFRVLPMRNDLLLSIMSCNHIGFHIYEYLRHFQNAVRRLLGIQMHVDERGRPYFDYAGRKVLATASFVGVEPSFIEKQTQDPKVHEYMTSLRDVAKGRIVFSSVQYLERLKGIPLQMETIKNLLKLHPELTTKIVVFVYCLNAQSVGRDYEISQEEVHKMADDINKQFSPAGKPIVIVKEFDKLPMTHRLALWAVTDVLLCAPIREGLNVVSLEYVCARQYIYGRQRDQLPGVVVLSEFTAASRCMSGAVYINPWNVHESTEAYYRAIEMSMPEKVARWDKFCSFVFTHTCSNWTDHIFSYIMHTTQPSIHSIHYSLGLGLGRKVLGLKSNFEKVNTVDLIKRFKSSTKRILFLDYGGTIINEDTYKGRDRLLAMEGRSQYKTPSKEVMEALKTICKYTDTYVYIISGRSKEELQQTMGGIKNLGLAAEEGFYYKMGDKDTWCQLIDTINDSWRPLCRSIMEKYTYRTNGSFIEDKGSSLVWQYKDSDPDFGTMQAQDLEDNLTESLEGFPVEVLKGGDYVEVRPKGINKGAFVKHVLRYHEEQSYGNLPEESFETRVRKSSIGGFSEKKNSIPQISEAINNMSASEYKNECKIQRNSSGNKTLYNSIGSGGNSISTPTHSSSSDHVSSQTNIKDMMKASLKLSPKGNEKQLPDFIMGVGDDTTDESMFKAIHDYAMETVNPNRHINMMVRSLSMADLTMNQYSSLNIHKATSFFTSSVPRDKTFNMISLIPQEPAINEGEGDMEEDGGVYF